MGLYFCIGREPTNGRHDGLRSFGPLSLIIGCVFFGREEICQGRLLPAQRTLDRFPPSLTIKTEGKGAGGLRGLVPLAEYEAAPHARLGAPSLSPFATLFLIWTYFAGTVFCPIVF